MDPRHYRNRLRRLRILQFLSQAYPEPLSDRLLLTLAKKDPELSPNRQKIRRSLQYLKDRGYVAIELQRDDLWIARCLPDGIDYLEGEDPGIDGLAHPDSAWSPE
ncbi:MAG: hypothetical protein KZQ99_04555 [Candidatus Thiodiazotropha sp. (ex Dulcina madagascariensis)]|nr:hypothetical protein [Candidatus Thiodiazotropha sp. (ex Dulcina madagascariensis)]